MLGAIIGDIVGSRFEFREHKGKDFAFFTGLNKPTDDSLMTLAVAKALLLCDGDYTHLSEKATNTMREIAKKYPNKLWGERFYNWLFYRSEPYGSYGNGSAMRVSPIGWVADSEEKVKSLSLAVTEISHNHPEGIKGAEAVAMAVYLAREGKEKAEIRQRMEEYYPILKDRLFKIPILRGYYGMDEFGHFVSCQGSVPHALEAFFESESFEDAIRNAVSIGGDSDTLGAMCGAVAEAYYGIPDEYEEKALTYLSDELCGIYYAFSIIRKGKKFDSKIH